MQRTSDSSKSLTTTTYGAFFDAAAATASPALPFVYVAVSMVSHRFSFNDIFAGLGTLPDESKVDHPRGHMPNSTVALVETPRRGATENLIENHQGGPQASWQTPGRWHTTLEPGMTIDLHRDDPGPPCVVSNREGCRQHIGGRLVPTRIIAASVTE